MPSLLGDGLLCMYLNQADCSCLNATVQYDLTKWEKKICVIAYADLMLSKVNLMNTSLRKEPMPELELLRLSKGRSPKAPSGLTFKQDAFCQYVASGCNLSDAYRKSFCVDTAKPSTIHSKASALAARGEVQARIDELKQDIDRVEEYLVGRNQEIWWKRIWAEAAPDDLGTTTPSSRVAALNLIGKALNISNDKLEPKPKLLSDDIGQQIVLKLNAIKARQTHSDDCI